MAWYPGAVRKEITKWRTPISGPRGFVYHVAVSESSSLFGYFSGAQVCSHFYIRRSGEVEQYVDTRYRAPANYQGNSSLLSVETQGGVTNAQGEGWTPQQLASLASLTNWASVVHGIPLGHMANSKSSSRGFGYHRQGIDPWRVAGGEKWSTSPGKICPGNQKIAEIPGIIQAAGGAVVPVDNGTPSTGNGGGSKDYLYVGDRGAAVSELQQLLTNAGFATAVDGIFGNDTLAKVRQFQSSRGLVIDGYAGPATMGALRGATPPVFVPPAPAPVTGVIVLQQGSVGAKVREVQAVLKSRYPAYGGKLVLDGIYGPATVAVVKEFQRRSGLAVDGVVGPLTAAKLGVALDSGTPAPPAPAPAPAPPAPSGLLVDGIFGAATVAALQRSLGITDDGIYGPQTKDYLQWRVGAVRDGIIGAGTIRSLQNYLNARGESLAVDGIWGAATTAALQRVLNAGTF